MPKPERPPAFQFYVDDFASDGKVEAMTTKAVGAYILLLCKAWREEPPGSIPNTDAVLARWARLTPEEWAECREMVLAAFSLGNDGRWHQQRMRREYEKSQSFKKQRAASAIKAAQARWHKPSIENEIDASRIRHASVTHPSRIRHAESSSSSSPSSAKEEEKNSARASWLGDAQDLLTNLYGGLGASEAQLLDQQIEQMAAKTIRGSPVTLADVKRFTAEKELPQVRFLANLFSSWIANQNRGINGSFTRQSSTEGSGHSPARKERELDAGKSI